MIIAIDAMGGDNAPDIAIEGAALALKVHPSLSYFFFGNADRIVPLIRKYPELETHSTIHHTIDVITSDMKPSTAFRQSRNTSMRLAIEAASKGEARAVVSAGNTGAYMGLSKVLFKCLSGIDRPAIPAVIPTLKGRTVMLDLGANVECTPKNLLQFAMMGDVFARQRFHIDSPSIGLLNIGSEESKGLSYIQEAHELLKAAPDLNYYGFVEGNDITAGTTDVVITDGFSGNIALKSLEGAAHLIQKTLAQSLGSSFLGRLAYLIGKKAFNEAKTKMDPRYYNGAPFLGLKGIAIKSHGGADGYAFSRAILVAVDIASQGFSKEIESRLLTLEASSSKEKTEIPAFEEPLHFLSKQNDNL